MIKPINGYVLIEPLKHNTFVSGPRETFEEIGIVLDYENSDPTLSSTFGKGALRKGAKVYFDAWLAGKYPSEKPGEFYWLVSFKDIKAIDYGDTVSE